MISVDKALSIFTDSHNNNELFDLEEIKKQMSANDYAEFIELISFMNLVTETNSFSRYKKIFEQLDVYKEEIYNIPSAANFRTSGGKATKDATENINKIFDEEFSDE